MDSWDSQDRSSFEYLLQVSHHVIEGNPDSQFVWSHRPGSSLSQRAILRIISRHRWTWNEILWRKESDPFSWAFERMFSVVVELAVYHRLRLGLESEFESSTLSGLPHPWSWRDPGVRKRCPSTLPMRRWVCVYFNACFFVWNRRALLTFESICMGLK
jgi:hypothetical protein